MNFFICFLPVSDCDSTDSSEEVRRGRAGRPSKLDKTRAAHLYESNYRVSPRCHASTKSLGLGIADIDDLEEAYLFQDERDLGLSSLSSLPAHLARDENSNDSFSSSSTGARASVKSESQSEIVSLAKSLDTLLQDPGDLAAPDAEPAKVPPTRSRISSEQLLSPKKVKKKKKVSVDGRGYEPLDQLVADNIDPVLLDCLEDELPTVPGPLLDLGAEDPMSLLTSFSSCRSMAVCNARWLRPNNRDTASSAKKDPKNKKVFDPLKPKRVIIYKDDLPGFSLDGDDEEEKLPVSKRGKPRAAPAHKSTENSNKSESNKDAKKKTKISKKAVELPPKNETLVEDEATQSDEDLESVESFSSTSSAT